MGKTNLGGQSTMSNVSNVSDMSSSTLRKGKNEEVAIELDIANISTLSTNRKLIVTIMLGIMSVVSLSYLTYSTAVKKIADRYLPVAPDQRVIKPIKASDPINTGEVVTFAVEALEILNTYSFDSYRVLISRAQPYFYSQEYWRNYLEAFIKSKNVDTVKARKATVSFKLTENPTIVGEKINERTGAYEWMVEVTGEVTYFYSEGVKRENNTNVQQLKFLVNIERIVTEDNSKLIGIKTINIKQNKPK